MQKYSKIDHPEILRHLFIRHKNDDFPLPDREGVEDVAFEVATEVFLACRHYPVAEDSPVVLFFPSPSSTTGALEHMAGRYNALGIGVFLTSYRGLGNNGGTPAVVDILADAAGLCGLAANWLKGRGYTGPLFVMGQSLGSIFAIESVLHNADIVKGLIIESGIAETSPFLLAIGAPAELAAIPEEEGFDAIRKIAKIKVPTLIFHGSRDILVPVAQAENLQACSGARSKQFFVIPGAGHDTLAEVGGELYYQSIQKHIDTVCGKNTWRERRKRVKKNGEKG